MSSQMKKNPLETWNQKMLNSQSILGKQNKPEASFPDFKLYYEDIVNKVWYWR